jgi:hypothetical protein
MTATGRVIAARHDWSVVGAEYRQIYEEAVS